MRKLWAVSCLAVVLAAAPVGAAAQEGFEDLVEDALGRNAPPEPADPALEPPSSSAVPRRLQVQPEAPPRVERRVRVIPEPEPVPQRQIIIQPAPDAAEPAAPRRIIVQPPPGATKTAEPELQPPALDAPPPLAEPPAGPRPYTPPRRAVQPETAEQPIEAPAAETTPGVAGDPLDPAVAPVDQAIGESPAEEQAPARSFGSLRVDEVNAATFTSGSEAIRGPSPIILKAQILLDRAGASPGVIDGISGGNVAKAIAAVETVLGLPIDGRLDAEVWSALGGDQAADVLVEYTITDKDAAYPYLPEIPSDYAVQAELAGLNYTSPEEMFAERFHMDVKLLTALNPGVDLRQPGNTIIVAGIEGQALTGKITRIEADKARRQVRAYDAQNRLVVAYPATIGSADNPSPTGDHIVNTIAPNPVYYYNPDNFVQGENRTKLELPPGPNNPVGTMWIDLSEPSYGIHGTPEPSKIDKTGSHGCIRLTNWDAEELATLVEPGVAVSFVE